MIGNWDSSFYLCLLALCFFCSRLKNSPRALFFKLSLLSLGLFLLYAPVFFLFQLHLVLFFPFLYPLCFPPGFFVSLSSLVLTRSSVSLRRNRGVTVLQFWFVLLGCSLVLCVCLFPGLSSLSNGFFFRVFSSGFSACSPSVSCFFFPVSPTWVFFFPSVAHSFSLFLLPSRSLIFSGFIARECQAPLRLKRLQSHYCRNRSCGRRRRRRRLISRNGAVCVMGMAICNPVTEVLESCNQAPG